MRALANRVTTEAILPRPTNPQWRAGSYIAAITVITFGILLRCNGLNYNFDHDEVFSVQIATQTFGRMLVESLADRSHPPLHYVLLWGWVHLTGPVEFRVRLLSVLLSLAFLSLLWRLSLRIMTPWASLLPVFLCSVSPFFVFYGEQARPYALVQLFATLTLYCIVRAVEEQPLRLWAVLYSLACLGLVYSQYIGGLFVAGELAVVFLAPHEVRSRLRVAGTLGVMGVVPWAVAATFQQAPGSLPWVPTWIGKPTGLALVEVYAGFFGTFPIRGTTRVLLLLTVGALAYLVSRQRTLSDWRIALLVVSAATPPLFAFLVSRYGPVSIWAERHLIGSAVAMMCLIAIGVSRAPRWMAWPLAIGFAAWTLLAAPNSFPSRSKPPYQALALDLSRQGRVLVGTEEWVVLPLQYYSPTIVHYLSHPDVRLETALTLVCRPVNCNQVTSLKAEYDVLLVRSLTWTPTPDPSSTLEVYVLTRKESPSVLPADSRPLATNRIPSSSIRTATDSRRQSDGRAK